MDTAIPQAILVSPIRMRPPVISAEEEIIFNRDIRPILSEKCFHCHGPDEKTREAKLRLDDPEVAYAEVLVPHSLEKSELWAQVTTDDEDEVMPPAETDKPLTEEEIALFKRWIETNVSP